MDKSGEKSPPSLALARAASQPRPAAPLQLIHRKEKCEGPVFRYRILQCGYPARFCRLSGKQNRKEKFFVKKALP